MNPVLAFIAIALGGGVGYFIVKRFNVAAGIDGFITAVIVFGLAIAIGGAEQGTERTREQSAELELYCNHEFLTYDIGKCIERRLFQTVPLPVMVAAWIVAVAGGEYANKRWPRS